MQGFLILAGGFGRFPLAEEGIAQVVVEPGVVRVESDGLVVKVGRLLVIAGP